MKNKSLLKWIISAVAIVAIFAVAFLVTRPFTTSAPEPEKIIDVSSETESEIRDYHYRDMVFHGISELNQYNPDAVGWLTIDGTLCDDPVMLAEDDKLGKDFYLEHDLDKNYNVYGTPYIDYNTTFSEFMLSRNITIYGHHMNDGSRFAQLDYYKDVEFYKEHPVFRFDTLYGDFDCEVFAVYIVDLTTDEGMYFNFRGPNYSNKDEYLKFINEIKSRSFINTPVTVGADECIVNLCTCTYVSSNARLMVAAKLVPRGKGAKVDVSGATQNENVWW